MMTTTAYDVDGSMIELEHLTKGQLEILFRHCLLRGDTARILKDDLIERIASCSNQMVIDGLGEMIEDLDLTLGDEKQQSTKGRTRPQHHPLTAMVRSKQGVAEADVEIEGSVFRIQINVTKVR